jgi:hypothetical protein
MRSKVIVLVWKGFGYRADLLHAREYLGVEDLGAAAAVKSQDPS